MSVSLTQREQLIALFAGEMEEGEWTTTPCATIPLAVEICKMVDPGSLIQLRHAVFGHARPEASIDSFALDILSMGWSRWQSIRAIQRRGRGL
jgi:hypothetical protein